MGKQCFILNNVHILSGLLIVSGEWVNLVFATPSHSEVEVLVRVNLRGKNIMHRQASCQASVNILKFTYFLRNSLYTMKCPNLNVKFEEFCFCLDTQNHHPYQDIHRTFPVPYKIPPHSFPVSACIPALQK